MKGRCEIEDEQKKILYSIFFPTLILVLPLRNEIQFIGLSFLLSLYFRIIIFIVMSNFMYRTCSSIFTRDFTSNLHIVCYESDHVLIIFLGGGGANIDHPSVKNMTRNIANRTIVEK